MTDTKRNIADTLRRAIKGEEDGLKFYDALAKRAANPGAKKKLEGLRDDEVRHKRTLLTIFKEHIGGEVGELPERGISPLADAFSRGTLDEGKSEIEYIDLAIKAELAATNYYQKERDLVDDEKFREIFDRMAEEEHGHFELLQAEREALTGNYSWFEYGDSSPMEH